MSNKDFKLNEKIEQATKNKFNTVDIPPQTKEEIWLKIEKRTKRHKKWNNIRKNLTPWLATAACVMIAIPLFYSQVGKKEYHNASEHTSIKMNENRKNSTLSIQTDNKRNFGTIIGFEDNHTVEMEVGGSKEKYQIKIEDVTNLSLKEKDVILFDYTEEKNNQKTMETIKKLEKEMVMRTMVEGETIEENSKLIPTKEFYLYVTKDFDLNGNKLFWKKDENFNATIQIIGAEVDGGALKDEVNKNLNQIGKPYEMTNEEIKDEYFKQNEFFIISSNRTVSKTAILYRNANTRVLISLTIPNEESAEGITPRLYNMLKTIGN